MGSRFSRIAAPLTGVLAVLAAVGFVLAAPRLLDLSADQAAIPAPPAGTGEVSSVVAPTPPDSRGQTVSPGLTPSTGPGQAPPAGTAGPASPAGPGSPTAFPGIAPNERPTGGGISATPQPGVGEEAPGQDGGDDDHGGPSHPAKEHKGHKAHHGHGKGHEHHGNGNGNGHSGDGDGQQQEQGHGKHDNGKHGKDHSKHDNGNHNGWTKPDKDPPEKSHDSLGSGHGNGQKPDREHGQKAKHGKSDRRAHSHSRSRR